jgi:ParB family chromosome partitioning protein
MKLAKVKLSEIKPSNTNPRSVFESEDQKELEKSIAEVGLLKPLDLIKVPSGNGKTPYRIIDGERRYRALTKLNIDVIDALITDFNEEDVPEVQLIEHIQRIQLSNYELYKAVLYLEGESRKTPMQIARRLGKPKRFVQEILRLHNMHKTLEKYFKENPTTSIRKMSALAALPQAVQEAEFETCEDVSNLVMHLTSEEVINEVLSTGRPLSNYPFDPEVSYADFPKCNECIYNTAIQKDMFGKQSDAWCLNIDCAGRKQDQFVFELIQQKKKLVEEGKTLLVGRYLEKNLAKYGVGQEVLILGHADKPKVNTCYVDLSKKGSIPALLVTGTEYLRTVKSDGEPDYRTFGVGQMTRVHRYTEEEITQFDQQSREQQAEETGRMPAPVTYEEPIEAEERRMKNRHKSSEDEIRKSTIYKLVAELPTKLKEIKKLPALVVEHIFERLGLNGYNMDVLSLLGRNGKEEDADIKHFSNPHNILELLIADSAIHYRDLMMDANIQYSDEEIVELLKAYGFNCEKSFQTNYKARLEKQEVEIADLEKRKAGNKQAFDSYVRSWKQGAGVEIGDIVYESSEIVNDEHLKTLPHDKIKAVARTLKISSAGRGHDALCEIIAKRVKEAIDVRENK